MYSIPVINDVVLFTTMPLKPIPKERRLLQRETQRNGNQHADQALNQISRNGSEWRGPVVVHDRLPDVVDGEHDGGGGYGCDDVEFYAVASTAIRPGDFSDDVALQEAGDDGRWCPDEPAAEDVE